MANYHQRQGGHRNNHWQRFNNRERTLTQDSSASSFASASSSNYHHQSRQNSQNWSESDGTSFRQPSPKMGQEFRQTPALNSTSGQKDLEILEKLKESIINNQHEFFRSAPQPAALAKIYTGNASISPVPPHPEQIPIAQDESRKDVPTGENQRRGRASSIDSWESRKQVPLPQNVLISGIHPYSPYRMGITMLNPSVMNPVRMIPPIPNHLIHPKNRTMTCRILSNLLYPLGHLHIVALFLVALSSPPSLLQLGLIICTTTLPCGGDPYPTLDPRQISEMAASVNKGRIQRTASFGPIPTCPPAPNLCSALLLLPTLKGLPTRDRLMRVEGSEMILGIGLLNGTTDDTIALVAEPMTGHALSTTDVTRLINATETTIVNMIIRVLSVLRLLSTNKVMTILPGTTMNCLQLPVLRTINDHPFRMLTMTNGCHHHPPLLL